MFLSLFSFLATDLWLLLSHLSDRSSFPMPLSRDEERALAERLSQGDPQAKQELIEHNLRLVAHIAKKYARSGMDTDDLVSIGSIGLMKAVDTFRPESGRLSSYAARCVENEILMALRSGRKNRANVSLFGPVGTDKDGGEVRLMDVLPSQEDAVDDRVERKVEAGRALHALSTSLDDREKQVISLRFGLDGSDPLPQREVARRLSISRSYVSRIETAALRKLRSYLQE